MVSGLRTYIGGQAKSWSELNRDYKEGNNIRGLIDKLMEYQYLGSPSGHMVSVEIIPYYRNFSDSTYQEISQAQMEV